MRRFPDGRLVSGDAICSFNPIYGQGMTVAALEALALRDCLSRNTTDLPRRFFQAAARPIRQAWQLAAGGDLALPEIGGAQPLATRLFNGYADRVLTAAESDAAAFNQFARVTTLVDPATRQTRWLTARRSSSSVLVLPLAPNGLQRPSPFITESTSSSRSAPRPGRRSGRHHRRRRADLALSR
jgi:hypothetical protein